MTKRTLAIVIVAVLMLGGATAVIASSLGGSDEPTVHTLSGGQEHTGEMPPSSTGESMEGMDMGE